MERRIFFNLHKLFVSFEFAWLFCFKVDSDIIASAKAISDQKDLYQAANPNPLFSCMIYGKNDTNLLEAVVLMVGPPAPLAWIPSFGCAW